MSRKMMLVTFMVLPFLAARPVLAQDTLKLDLGKALEIALSENPTVKVADKEIQKKKYARKGSYASLFPQISFAGDYNRTLKKQVMYMDFDMGDMGGGSLPEGTDMSSMDEGFEVGRSNNWSLGFNASMPLVNASLWKSLSISALDVELAVEQARSSKIAMVNQVKKSFYAVLLASDSYRVFKQSYDNAMENYLDIKRKYEQGTVAEYDLIRADVTVKNTEPNLLQAENSLTLAKWQLKALLGMDLDLNIDCDGQLTDFKSSLFADYLSTDTTLSENTDLKQLDLQAEQLKKTLVMQKFDYLPTLSLTGLYQWSAMNNDFKFKNYRWNPYSMIGITLSVPIFSGGSKYHTIKAVQNTTMARYQMTIIFNVMISLNGRCCQITDLRDYRTDHTDNSTVQNRIAQLTRQASLKYQSEDQAQDPGTHNAADSAFHRFFRTQLRRHLMLSDEHADTVCTGIAAPGA